MEIPTDERDALLHEVDRFAARAIEPAVARHEAPIDGARLAALLDEAEALGLAGADAEPSGLAPWEGLEGGGAPGATLAVLARLGQASAAVAFAIHQRALGRATARAAGLPVAGPLAIAPQGRSGLGRGGLARALAGAPLDDGDRAVLADVHAPGAARILPVEPGFAALIAPVWTGGALGLARHARAELDVAVHAHAHGLDELVTAELRPRAAGAVVAVAPAVVAAVLAAHQLGLVAIALGAAARGHALARRFAAQRRQGGAPIDRHPAVAGLLGGARATLDGARDRLAAAAARQLDLAALPAALALRAQAHPALADAANAAVQVFGGLGYMRDTGAEKAVRDVNALRALAGAPRELALIVAEWERLHA